MITNMFVLGFSYKGHPLKGNYEFSVKIIIVTLEIKVKITEM